MLGSQWGSWSGWPSEKRPSGKDAVDNYRLSSLLSKVDAVLEVHTGSIYFWQHPDVLGSRIEKM